MILIWILVASTRAEVAALPPVITGTVTPADPPADHHNQIHTSKVKVSPVLSLVEQDPPQPRLAGQNDLPLVHNPPQDHSHLATAPAVHPAVIIQPPPTYQAPDLSVSPYWADAEGRPPPPAPHIGPNHLAPSTPTCKRVVRACNASDQYRTISGRCNNLLYHELGSAEQPMPRILPPVYDFAFMRSRSVAGGRLLPSPRQVSLLLVSETAQERPLQQTALLMQLGQLIDHDLVLTHKVLEAEISKDCVACSSWKNPACAPIQIPLKDPHISAKLDHGGERRCLPFIRSVADWRPDSAGHMTLQQRNSNTAFLDLSTVYGSDECLNEKIRLHSEGLLKESYKGFPQLVPADQLIDCRTPQGQCILTGDEKANEQLGLLVVHALYFREHNRLARELLRINPHWNDEKLFQEARKINIAQYQNMIYTEFLPALLGEKKMRKYKLSPGGHGYYRGYNTKVNPGILNEFATAAFRVGHSLVAEDLVLLDSHYRPSASIPLVDTFHNPSAVFGVGNYDGLLRGLVGTTTNMVDLRLTDTIVHRLFEVIEVPHSGQDLFALNIARGRDHAIASYSAYLAVCTKRAIVSWEDLEPFMSRHAIDVIRIAYTHVQDIDLFVGALAENPVLGGLVGPTLACIISYQFLNLKRGDRFWYENADAGFSVDQLHSIRRSSLARVVCESMDDLAPKIPKNVFHIHGAKNPLVTCEDVPGTNLDLWAEDPYDGQRYCVFLGHHYTPGRVVPVSPCSYCVCQPHGQLKCQPDSGGCRAPVEDEHCRKVCPGYLTRV
ncbi:salivary peroxidase/catechol oxidase-like [Panulirus ornatus]|uniref:salivary peroxidase/catechol oxidase-like n=1 Tax=Panulirus ornatus TaxID=150431 RepID=UPI003A86F914